MLCLVERKAGEIEGEGKRKKDWQGKGEERREEEGECLRFCVGLGFFIPLTTGGYWVFINFTNFFFY